MKFVRFEYFTEDGHSLIYQEPTAPLVSALLVSFGLVFVVLAALFAASIGGFSWPPTVDKFFGSVGVMSFLGFGVFVGGPLAYVAIKPQRIRFDAHLRCATGHVRNKLSLLRPFHAEFGSMRLRPIKVIKHEDADDSYAVSLECPGFTSLHLGTFDRRTDAERWHRRLQELLEE